MTTTINASSSAGLVQTADTSTILQLQTNGTAALTVDASQNVGIGTSSPAAKLDVSGQGKLSAITFTFSTSFYNTDNSISNYSAGNYLYVSGNSTGGTGGLYLQGAGNQKQAIIVDGISTGGNIAFQTNGSERARITSGGNFCLGTTNTAVNPGFAAEPTGRISIGRSNDDAVAEFYRSGTRVGQINVTTTATSYNTSSDYRLKEAISPMVGAMAKVALLKPCTYKWKIDGSDGQGFIAHELADVVPQCVSGEKDAVGEEQYEVTPAVKDEQGNIVTEAVMGTRTVPVYQGIDTSFLVATLTAAIQELKAIVDAQGAEIAALKGATA